MCWPPALQWRRILLDVICAHDCNVQYPVQELQTTPRSTVGDVGLGGIGGALESPYH